MLDTKAVEQKRKELDDRLKLRRERTLGDLRKILSMPEGRRVVWSLLSECKVFVSSYTGNSDTFFNEGKRSIGLGILEDLMASRPEAFTQMQREAAVDPLRVIDQKGSMK